MNVVTRRLRRGRNFTHPPQTRQDAKLLASEVDVGVLAVRRGD